MNKNTKHIFLLTTLLVLLVGLTAISASDVSDNTTADNTVSHVTTQDTSSVEPVQTTDNKISDNKKVQTTTKTIESKQKTVKKDTQINYYVSDSNGSDSNDGSNNKPYKTIQKAINGTTQDNTYNIHIKAGNYTGTGNTNLTVNGNYHINFIGEGINKTVIDGEVNFTVGNASVWGDDSYWNSYAIKYGNWGMNITTGNGHITISDMNFQHMYTTGGNSIALNPMGGITNHANLTINNVLFYRNLGGVGASIQNKAGATLTVNNTTFLENRKGSSTGCQGTSIYNNGTAIVNNSQFIKNAARWGTITNDHVLNISNSIIRDGISYDLASTYKSGSGISIFTGDNDYFNVYSIEGIKTNIQNCTFINNGQVDIRQGADGDLTVNNSVFNHSTGIVIRSNEGYTSTITNNQLIDMQPSTLYGDLSGENTVIFGIYNEYNSPVGSTNPHSNATIVNNTITLSDSGYAIRTSSNAYIANNTLNDKLTIAGGVNCTVINNNITTDSVYAVESISYDGPSENNTITGNYLIGRTSQGNQAVTPSSKDVIVNNTPVSHAVTVTITDDNYNEYFNNNGTIKDNALPMGSSVTLTNITNKKFIIDTYLTIRGTNTLYNTSFVVKPTGRVTINGLTINNINSTEPVIVLNSTYNTVTRATIIVNTVHPIHAMEINARGNTISNGAITLNCPASTSIADNDGYTTARSIGLLVTSSDNTFSNNQVNVRSTSGNVNTTIIGMSIQTKNSSRPLANNKLNRPSVTVTGNNSIGLYINNAYNITSQTNTRVQATGDNITVIKIEGNSPNNNLQGNYYVYGSGYGILTTGANIDNSSYRMQPGIGYNKGNITLYKISNANNLTIISRGQNVYGNSTVYDLVNITNSIIKNAQLTISGNNVTFLKLVNSTNITINNARITGYIDRPYNIIFINSNNNLLNKSNLIYTNSINLVNSTGNNITNNYISTPTLYGNEAVTNPEGNIILNNTPVRIIITNTTYAALFDNDGNFIYNDSFDIIGLGSDLHGVDLVFDKNITLENMANYTIYNGTLKFTQDYGRQNTIIRNININNTEKTAIISNTSLQIGYNNITVTGNNITAIISTSGITSYYNNNLILSGVNITAVKTTNGSLSLNSFNFILNASNEATLIDSINSSINLGRINTTINAVNTSTLVNANNYTGINIRNSNITQNAKTVNTIMGNNSAIENNDGRSDSGFTANTVNITGETVYVIKITNQNRRNLNYVTNIRNNNITINTTTPTTIITLDGTENNIINNTIIINTTNNNIPVISITNQTNNQVIGNYIKTNDLEGDYAVNHTGITIKFNTPGVKITDDNYNQYFTNGILNPDITIIEIGNDIHNKNMTFNTQVLVTNPDNHTIYNGTVIFNKEASGSNITGVNINNTDDRQSSIIVYSNQTNVINNNIYQENTNSKSDIILFDNIVSNDRENSTYITNNTITAKGPNITAINLTNSSSTNFTYNAGDMGYPIWRNVTDGSSQIRLNIVNNNITLQSNNPATAIYIGNTRTIWMRNNKIISDTYNNNTPLVTILNATSSPANEISTNYIEARDMYGSDAISTPSTISVSKTSNTPTNTTRATKINMTTLPTETKTTSNYPITINVENMFNEGLNGTITLKIDNTNTTLNLVNGQATYNYTPDAGNHTITATFTDNNGEYLTNSTTQNTNTRKENVTITINPINTAIYENTNITANITDEEGNPVNNGQVFFKINGKTLKDIYGNNIYVDVVNGTATLSYYIDSMKINTTTIVFTGNEYYNTARINTTVNVARTNATMKIEILNDNIKPGETAIVMVTVTDKNGNMVKSGKVIFKLNGKTIKDEKGNTITVRIHNGIAIFKYIVPANYSAKNYTLTAVSVGNTYNRVEAVTNLTLTKINTYIQPVNIQFNGNTLHVQASIISTSTQENVAYRETKVSVKINNKTFAKEVKITNGTINLNIDTSTIGRGQYKITIKAGENGIYNGSQLDTYTYKAPVKSALNQTSNNGTLVKA